MIHYNDSSEQGKNQLLQAFKTLKISGLLRKSGIRKSKGVAVIDVFRFLILLVFQGKNLYRFLDSKRGNTTYSKNTIYRFLNNNTFNWRRFLLLLAGNVTSYMTALTKSERVNVLILDDSIVPRSRSKNVELLARVHDHSSNRFKKGFTKLTLGWSDGFSFIPTDFAMLSSAKKSNRYQEVNPKVDKRTNGYKRRFESIQKKTDVAVQLIKNTLKQGVHASYILMDSWFTHEPMIRACLNEGLDVIGMVKRGKQKYHYQGKEYTLKELRKYLPKGRNKDIIGSLLVQTKSELWVKLVFVKNRNKKQDYLVVLSTDCSLDDHEIVRLYGNRWSIEVFFKCTKSLMKLGREFQGRSYDMMISHTSIVFTRYILLEWLRRNEQDEKTLGELFYLYSDEISDMDLVTALQNLMSLFVELINDIKNETIESIKSQLQHWVNQQARFIKALFVDFCWES